MQGGKLKFADLDDDEDSEKTELCPVCGENFMRPGEKMCDECKKNAEYEAVSYTHLDVYKRQLFPFAIFAVNFRCFSSCKLIEKAYSGLRYVVAVRYDIVYFVHVM